jgi:spore germination protein KA
MFNKRSKPKRTYRMQNHIDEQLDKKLDRFEELVMTNDLEENIDFINQSLGKSDDLIVRRFRIGRDKKIEAGILYLDGMVNSEFINEFIMKSLMIDLDGWDHESPSEIHTQLRNLISFHGLTVNEIGETNKFARMIQSILAGDTVLLVDHLDKAFLVNTKGMPSRGVEEPKTESVVRGPRDGFTEALRTNSAQIRKRLKDPDLRVVNMVVGKRTNTTVNLVYIEGIADLNVVKEIKHRIQAIETDGILESGYIEQYIEDHHWSPFPQIQNTERPDKVVANILEGKVAIVVDGTPFVLIAPAIFNQFYHSPEDYYERVYIGTFIRFIRIISMIMALLLPSLYIAFSSFHPEMIPSRLVIAMAAGRSTVPFPSIVEALLMEISIEILREASVRLPGPIGPTIGIVGALVVGEAAVQAGIVSPIMVIIVAMTTIGSFASPSYSAAIALRMLRFPMMIAAAVLGLYGIMMLIILIFIHLCSMKSFGVSYMAPFAPSQWVDMKDTLARPPFFWMRKRPEFFNPGDVERSNPYQSEDPDDQKQPTSEPES